MIYVVTVHWKDPKWIRVQSDALRRELGSPFRTFANLEGIADPEYDTGFQYTDRSGGTHPDKLNKLAAAACARSESDDDILVFLDGDAFPIRPLDPWIGSLLAQAPLAAVRRLENAGDVQPHPCFCVTTVGFWKHICGDWNPGPTWVNSRGEEVSDVGGRLWELLRRHQVEWTEILRSNTRDLHPVMFGTYGGHIYHHGAGFRAPILRVDGSEEARDYRKLLDNLEPRIALRSFLRLRPRHLSVAVRGAGQRGRAKELMENAELLQRRSESIYAQIIESPYFYRQFEEPRVASVE